jgi:hypothetical protein
MQHKLQVAVTEALIEALGVPQKVGLSAEECVRCLLDVEEFLRGEGRRTGTNCCREESVRFRRRRRG